MSFKNAFNKFPLRIFKPLPHFYHHTGSIRKEIVIHTPKSLKSFPSSPTYNFNQTVLPHSHCLQRLFPFPFPYSLNLASLDSSKSVQDNVKICNTAQEAIMTAPPVPMPTRRSKAAPRFNVDDPRSLWEYFVDYEVLAEAARLDEATKIKQSVIYLGRDDADFWESLDEYAGNDWQVFKNTVLSFYPGSSPTNRWTFDDLSTLCDEQKTKLIRTKGDFAEFDRRFSTISKFLLHDDLLSDLEERKLYWKVLDQSFKEDLFYRIKLAKPAYTKRTIFTIAEIRSAADLVLDDMPADTSSATSPDTTSSTPAPFREPVKAEPFSMEHFTQQMATMMAQTVETAITTAFDRVASIQAPHTQTNNSRDRFGAFSAAHVSEASSAYPRTAPWMPKVDEPRDCFSNVASLNTNAATIGSSTNLVKVKNVSPVKTCIKSKTSLDPYIAALQKMHASKDDDEEAFEDVVAALKAHVRNKKMPEEISSQSPQEKRATPTLSVPVIPVKAIVPPKSAPVPIPPSFQVSGPYRLQPPHEVSVEPVEIPEDILSQNVTLSVGKLLASCPDVRKRLEAVTSKQVMMKSPKKDPEKTRTTSSMATYSFGENPQLGTIVACPSQPRKMHIPPSESTKTLVEELLVKEDIVEEKKRNLKNCNEEILGKYEEFSHRRIVFESFERDRSPLFPTFSYAIESHRIAEPPMYSPSPHVELSTLSSMCPVAPPVPPCHPTIADPPRTVFIESSVVAIDQEYFEMKDSRPPVLKKIVPLPGDPKNEESVQLEMSRMVVPACTHLETLPKEESLVYSQNADSTPSLSFTNPHMFLVEFPVVPAAMSLLNESPIANASPWSSESHGCRDRALKRIVQPPYDARNEGLVQYGSCRIVVPSRPYPAKLPSADLHVYARNRDPMLASWLENPRCPFDKSSVFAMSFTNKSSTPSTAALIRHEKHIKEEKIVPEETRAAHQYSHDQLVPLSTPLFRFENPHASIVDIPPAFETLRNKSSVLGPAVRISPEKIANQEKNVLAITGTSAETRVDHRYPLNRSDHPPMLYPTIFSTSLWPVILHRREKTPRRRRERRPCARTACAEKIKN